MVDDVFERARQRKRQIATRDGHRPLARQWFVHAMLVALWIWAVSATAAGQQFLPSWNDGPAKAAIIDFVRRVTRQGSPDFVPVAERIATFDNDGTLWSEQPI